MLKRIKPALIMLGSTELGGYPNSSVCLEKDYDIAAAAAAGVVIRKFLNALKAIHVGNTFCFLN